MEIKRLVEKDPKLRKDDLIVITGAGGFIAAISRGISAARIHTHPGGG